VGRWDEWHLDFPRFVTLEKIGDYPPCPDSRKEPRSKPAARAVRRRADRRRRQQAVLLCRWPAQFLQALAALLPGRGIQNADRAVVVGFHAGDDLGPEANALRIAGKGLGNFP